jgi:predicted O-methyltransferase YrrM
MTEKTWSAVDAFFEGELLPADDKLEAAIRASSAAGLPAIQISPSQGKLLYLLARLQGAKRILEVGTLGGYSTIWLARAVAPAGAVITLEVNPRHAKVARANFAHAGIDRVIELREGPALDSLEQLVAESPAPFDLVFIDADKVNNLNYVRLALKLTRVGSAIIVDNVVRGGEVVGASRDSAAEASRKMAEAIGLEPRLSATVIQTVGSKGYDGFLLARVET